MSKYIGRASASMAFALVAALGACKGNDANKDTTLAADSSLNRDLQMAGRDTTAQPQLNDVAANSGAASTTTSTTKRTTTTTTSRPSTSHTTTTTTHTTPSGNTSSSGAANTGGRVGEIAAGSTLNLHTTGNVCTNTTKVGDNITTTVAEAVTGSNGVVIPAGATVVLTATEMKRSDNARDPIVMQFAVKSVTFGGHTYPLNGTIESAGIAKVRSEPASKDAQKVAIGAAAGAIAGRILGKSTKSTVIGGAVGAAAGAATAAATANYDGCIYPTGTIVVKTTSPVQIKA